MTFSTENSSNDGLLSREEAVEALQELAESKGIRGTFNVYLKDANGAVMIRGSKYVKIASEMDLPERVSMNDLEVSVVQDQARV